MRSYPTVATHPNRKQRKSMRRKIFQENKEFMRLARKARRAARGENK